MIMEDVRLYLLKFILIAIIFTATVQAASIRKTDVSSSEQHDKELALTSKAKRSAYGRNWGNSPDYNTVNSYNNNFPPYLVFNRKAGAYYPYYKYPSDSNNIRRNMRKIGQYNTYTG